MAHILHLPPEILRLVASFVLPDDLLSFATSCRLFWDVSDDERKRHQFLLSLWRILNDREEHLELKDPCGYHAPALVELSGDQEKALCVRELRSSSYSDPLACHPCLEGHLEAICSHTQVIKMPEVAGILNVFPAGDDVEGAIPGVLFGLALELLPNLREIRVAKHELGLIAQVIPRLRSMPRGLRCRPLDKLKTVRISRQGFSTTGFGTLAIFLQLPQLKEFYDARLIAEGGETLWVDDCRSATFDSISLQDCVLSVKAVDEVLSRMNAVRRFIYSLPMSGQSPFYKVDTPLEESDPQDIRDLLLLRAQNTLCELEFGFNDAASLHRPLISSLREFKNLKKIRIAREMLEYKDFSKVQSKRRIHRLDNFFPISVEVIEIEHWFAFWTPKHNIEEHQIYQLLAVDQDPFSNAVPLPQLRRVGLSSSNKILYIHFDDTAPDHSDFKSEHKERKHRTVNQVVEWLKNGESEEP